MNNTEKELTAQEILENEEEENAVEESSTVKGFLTFVSDGLTFGVPTEQVMEIITNHQICSIPLVPDYVRGVINLRGQTIPIIDIRLCLGKPFVEYSSTTCIIILDIGADRVGIGVDAVSQVIAIDTTEASPVPLENRQKLAPSMVTTEDGKVVLLLNCPALIEP